MILQTKHSFRAVCQCGCLIVGVHNTKQINHARFPGAGVAKKTRNHLPIVQTSDGVETTPNERHECLADIELVL